MTALLHYSIQLHDERTGAAILASGGTVTVCLSGDAAKETLYTKTGGSASNPVSLTNGKLEFWVDADTVSVDLYGIGPNGEAIIMTGVRPGGDAALYLSKSLLQVYKLPFAIGDTTATTETDTGHDLVTGSLVHGVGLGIRATTADSGITINVGTKTSESGDPDGFMAGLSVASAVSVKPTLTNGSATLGALLKVQDSANAGDAVPEAHVVVSTARSLTYTLSSGADTAEGFILLPVTLPA
ncbi:hypothetical protein [Ferrovibrio sp.]|uniref:hypothetical protein n=1 Tax=Ferrovibrio sp. TaxID=1917215 RepID=UPI00311EA07D